MGAEPEALPAELLRRIAERAPDAIVIADAAGRVRFWNDGAAEMFGFAAAEAVGQTLDLIIPEAQRARHWEGFNRVMRDGAPSRYGRHDLLRVPALRNDGSRLSVEFTLQVLDHAGEPLAVATLRDVTEQWQTMRDLRRRLAEAEAAAGE